MLRIETFADLLRWAASHVFGGFFQINFVRAMRGKRKCFGMSIAMVGKINNNNKVIIWIVIIYKCLLCCQILAKWSLYLLMLITHQGMHYIWVNSTSKKQSDLCWNFNSGLLSTEAPICLVSIWKGCHHQHINVWEWQDDPSTLFVASVNPLPILLHKHLKFARPFCATCRLISRMAYFWPPTMQGWKPTRHAQGWFFWLEPFHILYLMYMVWVSPQRKFFILRSVIKDKG